ncbi:MAG: branched-chain amino acid ABC transporter permease [Actinomycetota bacterium]
MSQALVVGIISGGIYGLYALGIVLVYRGSSVLNFAQAEVGTFALFVAQSIIVGRDQPYLVGALAAIATAVGIGIAFERLVVWPLRNASRLSIVVGTIALLSLVVTLELKIFGTLPRQLDAPIAGDGFSVAGVIVTPMQALSVVAVAVIALALAAFLRYTDFGLSVVAASQDAEAVRFLGIRLSYVSIFTWGLAAALGAIAALLIQPSIGVISPNAYGPLFIKALGAALIGGLTSMPGAFVGGVVVGVAESQIRHATLSSQYVGIPEVCIFAAVIATLLLRPRGLLGER